LIASLEVVKVIMVDVMALVVTGEYRKSDTVMASEAKLQCSMVSARVLQYAIRFSMCQAHVGAECWTICISLQQRPIEHLVL
jgi:hypothetical protein